MLLTGEVLADRHSSHRRHHDHSSHHSHHHNPVDSAHTNPHHSHTNSDSTTTNKETPKGSNEDIDWESSHTDEDNYVAQAPGSNAQKKNPSPFNTKACEGM